MGERKYSKKKSSMEAPIFICAFATLVLICAVVYWSGFATPKAGTNAQQQLRDSIESSASSHQHSDAHSKKSSAKENAEKSSKVFEVPESCLKKPFSSNVTVKTFRPYHLLKVPFIFYCVTDISQRDAGHTIAQLPKLRVRMGIGGPRV